MLMRTRKPGKRLSLAIAGIMMFGLLMGGCASNSKVAAVQDTANKALEQSSQALEEANQANVKAKDANEAAKRAEAAADRAEAAADRAENAADKAEAIFMQKMKK